uniref:tRNA-queuosine alpha-mannosyltransferase n=3 Tax=Photinus pyralis TaxID=7054 RepID=A0A1Y1LG02_PHOPY
MESPRKRNCKNTQTIIDSVQNPEEEEELETIENVPPAVIVHNPQAIFIEPFYGGSHKQLIDTLVKYIPNSHVITLSAKKWHWRARCGSLMIQSLIPPISTESVLFCSSVLSLCELLGMRPDLQKLKKIVYFHENQLVYPIREIKQRDIQFAYNQMTTCLAADVLIFNSNYNKMSFLNNLGNVTKIFPDNKPKNLKTKIEPKCIVLYFPLELSKNWEAVPKANSVLHIAWPHRWEFDKDPDTFLNLLKRLKCENITFRVSLLGETFADVPEIFDEAKEVLKDEIVHFGFVENKAEYYKVLQHCHVAISTARHEFYGVSMLEACFYGCFPLVPNRLVYPEIYPSQCIYSDDTELYLRLKQYCLVPDLATQHRNSLKMDFNCFSVDELVPQYLKLF